MGSQPRLMGLTFSSLEVHGPGSRSSARGTRPTAVSTNGKSPAQAESLDKAPSLVECPARDSNLEPTD